MIMAIKVVVFDLGGVVFDWNAEYGYVDVIPDPVKRKHFLEHICNADWRYKQDAGQSLAEGMEELAAVHPEHAPLIRQFYDRWPYMLNAMLPEGVELLEELVENQVPVYALTNWAAETWPYATSRYPFLQKFLRIVVSGQAGMAKPNPDIYKLMQDEILKDFPDLKADEVVFIDDTLVNVQQGERFGWMAIHHTNPDHTRDILAHAGLPVSR
jgi:2-haloacid dehalogenase